jgi:peptidyl-prolyl cis-trans isomerase C
LKDVAEVNEVETAPTAPTDSNSLQEVIISLGDKKLTMQHLRWLHPNAEGIQIATFARWWLENELLYTEAEKRGITNEPKAKFFSELMRRSVFGKELESRVKDAVKITDKDVLAYYEKNKQTDRTLAKSGYLSFSHIRTKTLEEAQAVFNRIKAGENINELAKELSISTDAGRGGVVDKRRYMVVKKFSGTKFLEAIKAAKEGELIGPIEVEKDGGYEYEVARKKSEIKPTPRPFEEVKDRIKSQLERTEKQKAFRSIVDSLKKEAADKIVKSPRLIEAEKVGTGQPKKVKPPPPKPEPEPTKPTPSKNIDVPKVK